MSGFLSVAGLLIAVVILLIAPLIPTLHELYRKTDAEPLNVIQQHAGDIRHFAHSFATFINELAPVIEQAGASEQIVRGILSDGSNYLILSGAHGMPDLEKQSGRLVCSYVAMFAVEITCPPAITFSKEIYARGDFSGGANSEYRAILGEKNITIGPHSTVLRWANANKEFIAAQGTNLYGRISAERCIRLGTNCTFLRLNAPRIDIGSAVALDKDHDSVSPFVTSARVRRNLYEGDYEVPAGEVVYGDIVTRGSLHIRSGARITGSVKSNKNLILESDVVIEGSVISTDSIVIGAECALRGPIIAERKISIHTGTRCGSVQTPTTVSSLEIQAESGVVVFGTLWARQSGRVVERL